MLYIFRFFFVLYFILGAFLYGQNNIGQFTLRGHYGYLMAHSNVMTHLTNHNHIGILEAEYNTQTDGSALWQTAYRKPRMGVSLLFAGLNNKEILGYALASYYHVDIPILQNKSTVFSGRIGAGLAYITKRFDLKANPKNTAIGTHINSTIAGNLNLKYKVKKGYYVEGGIAATHFSNALFRSPNLGLNLITTHVAITKDIFKYKCSCEKQSKNTLHNKKKWGGALDVGIAGKSIYVGDKSVHAAYNISTQVHVRLSITSKLKAGIEFFHDNTLTFEAQRQKLFPGEETSVARHIGMYLGHELWFSRVAVVFRYGYYLHDKWEKNGRHYQKYGVKYQFAKHFYTYAQVKTHFFSADYALWGIGVNF